MDLDVCDAVHERNSERILCPAAGRESGSTNSSTSRMQARCEANNSNCTHVSESE
jgi:hypothetical protein